ncbi:sensor histidine kinase [Paenibacillus sepulcri]|uniref:histidine kinase n=1 Tax=Paenibacillus sepulcri TaxID=359917 RepID=A0ABS7BY74_9BACL|nr:histidine kinase [Paenibacillus sepulcri]
MVKGGGSQVKHHSLKNRLITILFLYTLIPLLLLGIVSYLSIQNIYRNKIESGINNTLENISISLENTLSNMEYASLQLSAEGSVGQDLYAMLSNPSIVAKFRSQQEIRASMNLINFTNKDLGLMLYYFSENGTVNFETMAVNQEYLFNQTLLARTKGGEFYGPHQTAYTFGNNQVFSFLRPVDVTNSDQKPIYIYVETNLSLFEKILAKAKYGMPVVNYLTNEDGIIVYSDDEMKYPLGTAVTDNALHSTILFNKTSEQGWTLGVAIERHAFNIEFRKWLYTYMGTGLLCLALSVLLASLVWRIVYRPLKKIQMQLTITNEDHSPAIIKMTGIVEFDSLLREFQSSRDHVLVLFKEIEGKERDKARLEVEKLLYQINPHFIHNTLNTIQWIARMNNQEEIYRLISIFTRILHHNLGKEGSFVLLQDEIKAMQDYIALQGIRYDCTFDVRIAIEEGIHHAYVPRFILQPLLENALYHGMGEETGEGAIEVRIHADSSYLYINVSDSGAGMTEEQVNLLLSPAKGGGSLGYGIGLQYVFSMIKVYYGNEAQIDIVSKIDQGTTIFLRLPLNQLQDRGYYE